MKKLLFFISALAFAGCGSFKVANYYGETVKAGETEIEPNTCGVFSGGLFGDFPIKITKKDGSAFSSSAPADKDYEEGHWVVGTDGSVSESEEEPKCSEEDEDESEDKEKSKVDEEAQKRAEAAEKQKKLAVEEQGNIEKCKASGGTYTTATGRFGGGGQCVCPAGKIKSTEDPNKCVDSGNSATPAGGTTPATN